MNKEPEIIINSRKLTVGESMAVRVAVSSMRTALVEQRHEVGSELADAYDQNLKSVEEIMFHMMVKDWVKDAADEIYLAYGEFIDEFKHIEEIIRKHCPMKSNTAYVELGEVKRLASLLVESKREHSIEGETHICPAHPIFSWFKPCTCGASEWNRRVDEALKGYLSID